MNEVEQMMDWLVLNQDEEDDLDKLSSSGVVELEERLGCLHKSTSATKRPIPETIPSQDPPSLATTRVLHGNDEYRVRTEPTPETVDQSWGARIMREEDIYVDVELPELNTDTDSLQEGQTIHDTLMMAYETPLAYADQIVEDAAINAAATTAADVHVLATVESRKDTHPNNMQKALSLIAEAHEITANADQSHSCESLNQAALKYHEAVSHMQIFVDQLAKQDTSRSTNTADSLNKFMAKIKEYKMKANTLDDQVKKLHPLGKLKRVPTKKNAKVVKVVKKKIPAKKSRPRGKVRELDLTRPIEHTVDDVLCARGSYANNHPGNVRFREKALKLLPKYILSSKYEKFHLSLVLTEQITKEGHRFLAKGPDGLWYRMVKHGARLRASQCFRDILDIKDTAKKQRGPTSQNKEGRQTTVSPTDSNYQPSLLNSKRLLDLSRPMTPMEDDVLFGRGGYANNYPGNINFRVQALEILPRYMDCTKEEKTTLSLKLVESVTGKGSRFLDKGPDGLWYRVVGNAPRIKANQVLGDALRDMLHLLGDINPASEEWGDPTANEDWEFDESLSLFEQIYDDERLSDNDPACIRTCTPETEL